MSRTAGRDELVCDRERGDDIAAWSPAHLVLSSLGICMLATFEAFAVRDRVAVRACRTHVRGTVDRLAEGAMFTSIVVVLDIELADDLEGGARVLEEAKRDCLVLNSLRVPVVIEAELRRVHAPPFELAG